MPRERRLSLPKSPGVYRMLRTSGDVLYVGKASSLHDRVNSHFRKQHGVDERTLEMLSQARAISFDVTPTPLEAALLETDEIKRHRPPYNLALAIDNRAIWFVSPDLSERSPRPSLACPLGPLISAETLDRFEAFARTDRPRRSRVRSLGSRRCDVPRWLRAIVRHASRTVAPRPLSTHQAAAAGYTSVARRPSRSRRRRRPRRDGNRSRHHRMDASARACVSGVAHAASGACTAARAVVDAPGRCERGVARARCRACAPDRDRTRRDRAQRRR
jgi:hypothetical protein